MAWWIATEHADADKIAQLRSDLGLDDGPARAADRRARAIAAASVIGGEVV